MKHTFAISAYGESEYLEDCICSLLKQERADIIICTSTPNAMIGSAAKKYGLPLYVRDGASSLKDDWNFAVETAVSKTGAGLVTVAHQDDIYHDGYSAALEAAAGKYPDMSLFCCRYATIDADGNRRSGRAEDVKRLLRLPLRIRALAGTGLIKKLPLVFGNGIGCPTCTYNIRLTGLPLFKEDYRFVIDWDTLLRLSGLPGRFICDERELVDYRVHDKAETKKNIDNHVREAEERMIFSRFWPEPIVNLLMRRYRDAYKEYEK